MTTESGHTAAIRAKKVIGTKVKGADGKTIGEIEDVVLDKLSNNIMFAVVSFGGFMGMGEKYHPLPWRTLRYDDSQNAYMVDVSEDKLRQGPADSIEALTANDGAKFRDRAYEYYNVTRYW